MFVSQLKQCKPFIKNGICSSSSSRGGGISSIGGSTCTPRTASGTAKSVVASSLIHNFKQTSPKAASVTSLPVPFMKYHTMSMDKSITTNNNTSTCTSTHNMLSCKQLHSTTKSQSENKTQKQITQKHKKDPTAKRPTKKCDPYGLNGQPMSHQEAIIQLGLLESGWCLVLESKSDSNSESNSESNNVVNDNPNSDTTTTITTETESSTSTSTPTPTPTPTPPRYLQKEFYHTNYLNGSNFISKIIASVAHNNNHYPKIILERRLMKQQKSWTVVSTVQCSTEVLNGLSFHDFYVAMMIDVEVGKLDKSSSSSSSLIVNDLNDSLRKHT